MFFLRKKYENKLVIGREYKSTEKVSQDSHGNIIKRIYCYKENRSFWICSFCEFENTEGDFCYLCGEKRDENVLSKMRK